MARLTVEISPRAFRDLGELPEDAAAAILVDLKVLEATPWPGPPKVKKLRGTEGLHRLRTGDFRSIFEKRVSTVVVLRVVDRKEFDRALRAL